jgi:hypothetical protein
MLVRGVAVCGINLILLAGCGGLGAQTAPPPTAYTVTAKNAMAAPGSITKTYRLGSKALIEQIIPAHGSGAGMHTRTLFDLQKNVSLTWNVADSSANCSKGTVTGDWGDPFAGLDALIQQGAKQVGTETIQGHPAKVLEASEGDSGKLKAWVDLKTSMILKAQMIPPTGAPTTLIEVADVSLAPPPGSVFALPATCGAAASAPPPPTEADKIAALTGGNGQDYLNGIYGPGSKNSCTMVLRIVHAGTMEPITSGFQVGADLAVATEPPPHYDIHMSRDGHTTFSGGGLHEIVSPTRNGVFRIDDIPAQFEMDIEFGDHGSARANLYRQCFAAQTVLLYVVKNPANISDGGDWLWVKSGKYATVPH